MVDNLQLKNESFLMRDSEPDYERKQMISDSRQRPISLSPSGERAGVRGGRPIRGT